MYIKNQNQFLFLVSSREYLALHRETIWKCLHFRLFSCLWFLLCISSLFVVMVNTSNADCVIIGHAPHYRVIGLPILPFCYTIIMFGYVVCFGNNLLYNDATLNVNSKKALVLQTLTFEIRRLPDGFRFQNSS